MVIIEDYAFGEITIDGKKYREDVIVFPDHVIEGWYRSEEHSLTIEDLWEALEYNPKILVIGTGYSGRLDVPSNIVFELEKKGIRVIVQNTKNAVEVFNKYVKENKRIVAVLHITC